MIRSLPVARLTAHTTSGVCVVPVRPTVRSTVSLVAIVVVLGTLATGVGAAPATAGTGCVAPPVAHRGDSARAPENTMPAYRKALRLGVRRLEVDVRFTSNDVPVLMHDATVDRTTDGRGDIAAMALSEVRALDAGSWFSRRYAGVKVPTLHQVLSYGRTRGARFLVELKTRPTAAQMDAVLNRFRWLGMTERVRVTSFDGATIRAVRAAMPGLRTGKIDYPRYRRPSSVLSFGRTYLVHHHSVTERRAKRWQRAGIEIRPWTVDGWRAWRRMAWDRSGPVITNRPKAYLAWARVFCS